MFLSASSHTLSRYSRNCLLLLFTYLLLSVFLWENFMSEVRCESVGM